MNAPPEEAAEFAKISKRDNRVYVGNLGYDIGYGDLMNFMRGGRLLLFLLFSEDGVRYHATTSSLPLVWISVN
jgi:hypothetical protein